MVDETTGETFVVDESEAKVELARGSRMESDQEREAREYGETAGLGEAAIATGEGLLRGVDPTGLSSVALAEVGGDEYRQRRAMREQEFGGLMAGAELGGTVATTLLSGGTSAGLKGAAVAGRGAKALQAARTIAKATPEGLITRGGRAATEGTEALLTALGRGPTVSRAGGMATGAALEGAAYGGGAAVHEAALRGDYSNLEEKILAGAKNGALFGGIAGGGLGVAGSGVGALGGKLARSKVGKRLADESWLQAINPSKAELRQLTKGGRDVERQLTTGRRLKDLDIVGAGRSKEQMLRRAEAVVSGKGDEIGSLVQKLDDLGAKVDDAAAGNLTRRLDELGGALEKQADDAAGLLTATEKRAQRRFATEVKDLRGKLEAGTLTHKELHGFRRKLGESTKWAKQAADPVVDRYRAAYGAMSDAIEESGERVFTAAGEGGFVAQWKNAQQDFAAAKWAEDVLQEQVMRGQANMSLGLTEQLGIQSGLMTGLASGSLPALGGGAIAGALISGAAKRYGRGVLAEAIDTAARVEKRMRGGVKRFIVRDVERKALAEVAAIDERARADNAAKKKAAKTRTDKALRRRPHETPGDAYRRTLTELHRGATAAPPLTHVAADLPETATRADAIGRRASEYLLENAPTPPIDDRSIQPTLQPPDPHPTVLAKWAQGVEIARDPMQVVDLLEQGKLTYQHVDALRNIYPGLYQEMQQTAMEELAARRTPLPYLKRVTLGTLLDIPTDPSLRPEAVAASQGVYAARRQAAQQPPGPQGGGTGTPGSIGAQFKSMAQQIESANFEGI